MKISSEEYHKREGQLFAITLRLEKVYECLKNKPAGESLKKSLIEELGNHENCLEKLKPFFDSDSDAGQCIHQNLKFIKSLI